MVPGWSWSHAFLVEEGNRMVVGEARRVAHTCSPGLVECPGPLLGEGMVMGRVDLSGEPEGGPGRGQVHDPDRATSEKFGCVPQCEPRQCSQGDGYGSGGMRVGDGLVHDRPKDGRGNRLGIAVDGCSQPRDRS